MPETRQSVRHRLDIILDGDLRGQLIQRREQGDSLDDLVLYLGKLGVLTTRETLRQWFLTADDGE